MTIEHKIIGHDMQSVEFVLKPGEEVKAEAGTLLYMEQHISYDVKMGKGGVLGALGRSLTGAGVFLTHFKNQHSHPSKVAFAANSPGKIVHINLSKWANSAINVEHNGFLAATGGTDIDTKRAKRIKAGIFGRSGFYLQHISGPGSAYLHCCGAAIERTLNDEEIRCDPGSVVAFEDGIDFSVVKAGGLKTMMLGGDVYFVTLKGTGKIILQGLPWGRVVNHIVEVANASR